MNQATQDYIRAHRAGGAAAIATALAADGLLAGNIPIPDFAAYVAAGGLLQRLQKTAADPRCPVEVAAGIQSLFWFTAQSGVTVLGTANPDVGAQYTQALTALVQLRAATGDATIGLSQAEADTIVDLGGGYRYDRATADEVAAALTELDQADARQALRTRAAVAYNGVVSAIDGGARDWTAVSAVFAGTEG